MKPFKPRIGHRHGLWAVIIGPDAYLAQFTDNTPFSAWNCWCAFGSPTKPARRP